MYRSRKCAIFISIIDKRFIGRNSLNHNDVDRKKEAVFVQNVMVRGLCSQEDWKFPVFVDFDRRRHPIRYYKTLYDEERF